MAFVIRILFDRYDRLVFLRFYETEIKCLFHTLINGIYLFKKDAFYSEVFYGL